MNQPLLSVLLPSLWRFDRLKAAVQSWRDSAAEADFEIIVRLHKSDPHSCERAPELGDVQVVTGRDKKPDESVTFLWNELIPLARGRWVQFWADDLTIKGDWASPLKRLPDSGVIGLPEIFQLDKSRYRFHEGQSVPFVPTDLAKRLAPLPNFPDYYFAQFVRSDHWHYSFLPAVEILHSRFQDPTMVLANPHLA